MIRRPPRSTRTDTLFPYTTLFRSDDETVLNSSPLGRQKDLPCQGKARVVREDEAAEGILTDSLDPPAEERQHALARSEEHTSELQPLMRISYPVSCLIKKNHPSNRHT